MLEIVEPSLKLLLTVFGHKMRSISICVILYEAVLHVKEVLCKDTSWNYRECRCLDRHNHALNCSRCLQWYFQKLLDGFAKEAKFLARKSSYYLNGIQFEAEMFEDLWRLCLRLLPIDEPSQRRQASDDHLYALERF